MMKGIDMKPIIGISCSMGQNIFSMTMENRPQLQHRLNDTYVNAILAAGGIPVILPNLEDTTLIADLVSGLDGILLSGGGDVDPIVFGQRATGHLGTVTPRRDTFELALAKYVLEQTQKPVLGICRGIQVMNVAMGGTLHIDLPDDGKLCHSLDMYPRDSVTHDVSVTDNTCMERIMGGVKGSVNSFHHQAVKDAAECFVVSARSVPDNVIEAMEMPDKRFAVGVQWHPEELVGRTEARKLFSSFVEAAKQQYSK